MNAQPKPDRAQAEAPAPCRPENLALVFQEVLTAIVRLRSNRQAVSDAEVFRGQVKQALHQADQESKRLGYIDDDIRLAVFAVVAFLDESILNLRNPVFHDWVRKPLQEELFGRHIAGEVVFENVQKLLGRRDSPPTADVLEVYYLCLLLGYVGKYSILGKGELRAIMGAIDEKIQRIRKNRSDLSPHWELPGYVASLTVADPWVRRIVTGAGAGFALALVLFIIYKLALLSGVSDLKSLAQQITR